MSSLYSRRYNYLTVLGVLLVLISLSLSSCSGAEVTTVKEQKEEQLRSYAERETETHAIVVEQGDSYTVKKKEVTDGEQVELIELTLSHEEIKGMEPSDFIETLQGEGLILSTIGSPNRVKSYNNVKFNNKRGYTSKDLLTVNFTEAYGVYKLRLDFSYPEDFKNTSVSLLFTYRSDRQGVVLQQSLQGKDILGTGWESLEITVN